MLPLSAASLVPRAHAVNAREPVAPTMIAPGDGASRRFASITPKSEKDKENLPRARAGDELPQPADNDRDRPRILRIQEVLRDIVHGATLSRLRVGMRVVEARSGRLLFGRRPAALMDPASNQKVLATATAIMRLGSDWRFRTELTGPEPNSDGVIKGDVYLRGSGDPTMRSPDLEMMAQRLARRGIRRIEGGVIADTRRIGTEEAVSDSGGDGSGGGDSSDRGGSTTRPPLVVNRGFMQVRVRPGSSAGSFAEITTTPNDDSFEIRNTARTRASGTAKINVDVSLNGSKIRVDVTGTILVGQLGFAFKRKVPHQALYAASLLRASLIQAGVQVLEPARVGTTPAGAAMIERHESEPLGILLRKINKESDNDQAERVLEAAGAEVYGGAPTPDKGVRLLREVIGELGLTPGSYVSRNGSGLGHANRITAEAMATLLARAVPGSAHRPGDPAVAVGWRRRRHDPQPFQGLAGGQARAREDRHADWQVLPVRLRRRRLRRAGLFNPGRGTEQQGDLARGTRRAGRRRERDDALRPRRRGSEARRPRWGQRA